jgi:hypothetical protein
MRLRVRRKRSAPRTTKIRIEKMPPVPTGRRKGARNRISTALLEAIAKDFEEHGEETIKITRVEKPTEYLKIVASLLPREFEITDSRLTDISDEEIDRIIDLARRQIIDVTANPRSGESAAENGEPVKLLPPV